MTQLVAGAKIEAGEPVGIGPDGKVYPMAAPERTPPSDVLLPPAAGPAPFAYEVSIDDQLVRLEAPTLAGLLDLMAAQDVGTSAVVPGESVIVKRTP